MPLAGSDEANGLSGALATAKRHPIMTATVVVGLLGGAVLGGQAVAAGTARAHHAAAAFNG